jgi:hypothetical protein
MLAILRFSISNQYPTRSTGKYRVNHAALPPHIAERLSLSGEGCRLFRGCASKRRRSRKFKKEEVPVSRRLTAVCCGKATGILRFRGAKTLQLLAIIRKIIASRKWRCRFERRKAFQAVTVYKRLVATGRTTACLWPRKRRKQVRQAWVCL